MDFGEIWKRIFLDIKNYYLALILFLIYNIVIRMVFDAFCPFLIVTGFPCAGCGMTRAVFYILTGQIARGMQLNPTAPLWMAWIALFLYNRYVRGKSSKWITRVLILVAAITLAVYIYRMITQFPGNPPMTYYKNNIITKCSRLMFELLQ